MSWDHDEPVSERPYQKKSFPPFAGVWEMQTWALFFYERERQKATMRKKGKQA